MRRVSVCTFFLEPAIPTIPNTTEINGEGSHKVVRESSTDPFTGALRAEEKLTGPVSDKQRKNEKNEGGEMTIEQCKIKTQQGVICNEPVELYLTGNKYNIYYCKTHGLISKLKPIKKVQK